jgi:glutamyl-tRNA synthetase
VQVQMFEALGAGPPRFAHEALLVAPEGKLSKRLGAIGIDRIREAGLEPMALLSLLARIGTSQPVEPVGSLEHLARDFDFAHFGRAPAHFDLHEVELVNAKLVHAMDFAEVRERVPDDATQQDWEIVRPNLTRVSEFADWLPVLRGDVELPDLGHDERALVREAAAIAEGIDWSSEPWRRLTDGVKAATGQKGRALFHPLRLAISGRDSGPEMAGLVERIGKERVVRRLNAVAKR